MPAFGYSPSSEEFGPNDLVRFARRAERAGFSFALISDHYHPWTRKQGHSPLIHQVGKDQEGFFRFYEREVLPALGVKPARAA